jgi:Protein of unknown function (DUF3500)
VTANSAAPAQAAFREFLPGPDDPMVCGFGDHSGRSFTDVRTSVPMLQPVVASWRQAYEEPFVGITTDGRVQRDLYSVRSGIETERPPLREVLSAVTELRAVATDAEWDALSYALDAPEWRGWSNPEFIVYDTGLRLEEVGRGLLTAIFRVVEASLSCEGYSRMRHLMRLNAHLGRLVGMPGVMNEGSYQFALFGEPSESEPWGWHLHGHHLCANVLFTVDRMVIGPVFLGAEPDQTDEGPDAGIRVLEARERLGVEFINSLTAGQLAVAREYDDIEDPSMPAGRVHPADGRHLGGAFSDNRIVPLEGLAGRDMTPAQREKLLAIAEEFSILLPSGPRAARMREVAAHLDETYITWIGGLDAEQAFYYRVQSPVIMAEFDHHNGMYLTNPRPARFHVHTILRLPNGGDYGRALLDLREPGQPRDET